MSTRRKRRCVGSPRQSDSSTEDDAHSSPRAPSSTYLYTPLPQDVPATRLLRLLPSADKNAPIRCDMFNYTLEAREEEHLYEALSYTWGDPNDTEPVILDGSVFHVTKNLRAALRHLRDRLFERILWVDAVCINQRNLEEKEGQIQSMASIFGYARQVTVWLGQAGEGDEGGGDLALHHIRAAAKGLDGHDDAQVDGSAMRNLILSLLKRSWFRRVWILQEVAMARTVLLTCGHATITGHAFCAGLKNLNLPTQEHPELLSRISSLAYLIDAATLRPKYAREVLGDTSLPELIDMYHDREASVFLDKVFALLSMASDGAARHKFRPNYSLHWEELFRQLVDYCLGSLVSVRFYASRRAFIEGKGIVIGTVGSIERNSDRYDLLQVIVHFHQSRSALRYQALWGTEWTLQRTANPVKVGDAICLIEGASSPLLLRACDEYFRIINIRVTTRRHIQGPLMDQTDETQHDRRISSPALKFLLKWEWLETHMPSDEVSPEAVPSSSPPSNVLDVVEKRYEVGRCLIEIGENQARRAIQALRDYDVVLGTGRLCNLASRELTALTYQRQRRWDEAIAEFSSIIQERKALQGRRHPATLQSMTSLAMTYAFTCRFKPWNLFVLNQAISGIHQGLAMTETATALLIDSGSMGLLKTVLEISEGKIPLTSGLLQHIRRYGNKGPAMMEMMLEWRKEDSPLDEDFTRAMIASFEEPKLVSLLERYGSKMKLTKATISSALEYGHVGRKTLELFLDNGKGQELTEDLITKALRNPWMKQSGLHFILERNGVAPINLTDDLVLALLTIRSRGLEKLHTLLSQPRCKVQTTQHGLEEATRLGVDGHFISTALMRLAGAVEHLEEGTTPNVAATVIEPIMKAAAMSERLGADLTSDLLKFQPTITTDILEAAASNTNWGATLVEMLVASAESGSLEVTDGVLIAAAQNTVSGYRVMVALFKQFEFQVTAEVVEAVVGNRLYGPQMLELIYSRMAEATPITSKVLAECARSGTADTMNALAAMLRSRFTVTDDMWSGLAGNGDEQQRRDLLVLFLKLQKDSLDIPETVLFQLVHQFDDEGVQSILGCLGHSFTLTWEVVGELLTALQERRYYYDGNWLNWFKYGVRVSEGGVSYLLRDQRILVLQSICQRLGRDLAITERCIEGAANNGWDGAKLMEQVFSRAPHGIRITETALYNAVTYGTAASALSILLARRGASAPIPDWIATQAVKNDWESLKMLKVILDQSSELEHGSKLQNLVETAARHGNPDLLHYLLRKFGVEVQSMAPIVEAAASRSHFSQLEQIMSLRPLDLVVTSRVIRAVRHEEVLTWLLGSYPEAISVNRGLLRTIWRTTAGEEGLEDMREALLKRALVRCQRHRPLILPIPDDTLVELATRFDEDAVELFLDWAGGDFRLTTRIVRAAAASGTRPRQVLWVFLRRLRPAYKFEDEDVVVEIAKRCDEDTMAYMLDRWSETLTITQRTVEAVAKNARAGEIMSLLLGHVDGGCSSLGKRIKEAILAHPACKGQEKLDLHLLSRVIASSWRRDNDGNTLITRLYSGEASASVTEEVVIEAASRRDPKMQRAVVNRMGVSFVMTGAVIEAAEEAGKLGLSFLKACLLKIHQAYGSVSVTHEALAQATRRLTSDVVRLLLEVSEDKSYPLLRLLEEAAHNPEDDDEMARLLLRRAPLDQVMTESIIRVVAATFSPRVMEVILSRQQSFMDVMSNQMAIEAAVANPYGVSMVKLLLLRQKTRNRVPSVTEKVVEVAARTPNAVEILSFLLERGARSVRITEGIMEAAAASPKPDSTMALLATQWGEYGDDVLLPLVTESVMKAAVTNKKSRSGLHWLIRRWGQNLPITDHVLEAGMEAFGTIDGEHPVLALLRLRGGRMPITERTMRAVVGTFYTRSASSDRMMLELDMHDMELYKSIGRLLERDHRCLSLITEGVLRAAAERGNERALLRHSIRHWGTHLSTTPEHAPHEAEVQGSHWDDTFFTIPEDVLLEIAVQGRHWKEKLHLVLGRFGHDRTIPENVLRKAVAGTHGDEVLEYLLGHWADGIKLTEGVMASAAGGQCAEPVLTLIAEEWGGEAPLTEDVLVAAAANPQYDEISILEVILREWDAEQLITEKVFEAAASNPHDGTLFEDPLIQEQDEMSPSEREGEEPETAVGAQQNHDVTALDVVFRAWDRSRGPVPEAVVRAAAGNTFGKDALEFIVTRWGKQAVPMTDKVVEAAAGNPQGKAVLLFMIWRWGKDKMPMTDAVWRAARENPKGREILALLAERWGEDVVITGQ